MSPTTWVWTVSGAALAAYLVWLAFAVRRAMTKARTDIEAARALRRCVECGFLQRLQH